MVHMRLCARNQGEIDVRACVYGWMDVCMCCVCAEVVVINESIVYSVTQNESNRCRCCCSLSPSLSVSKYTTIDRIVFVRATAQIQIAQKRSLQCKTNAFAAVLDNYSNPSICRRI